MINVLAISTIIIVALLIAIPFEIKRRGLLKTYWLRNCTGKEWKKRFPDMTKEDIRAFLDAFVVSFDFSRKKRLNFGPDDKIIDIYRASYPISGYPDALELETFATKIQNSYGIDLHNIANQNITLGEIFVMTRRESQQEASPVRGIEPRSQ